MTTVHRTTTDDRVLAVDSGELVEQARATLVLAFADDPVTRWLFPRATDLLEVFPRMVDAFSRDAFEQGTARITRDGSGAAVWLPPALHIDEPAMEAIVGADIPASIRSEAADFFGAMDSYHPDGELWYLPLIGVQPGWREQRRGSALLAEGLARCDDEHLSVYLESTNPRNIPF